MKMKTDWDYSERAHTYDCRADYSKKAILNLLNTVKLYPGEKVADIGAGTGKLTKVLIDYGLNVLAVEPNKTMRNYGMDNLTGRRVTWFEGKGEETGLEDNSVKAVFFGSSFNVVNQPHALVETARVLRANGIFSCMWNHRDTADVIQREIELIIRNEIPNYNYGSRRRDPTKIIQGSGLFGEVMKIEETFSVKMKKTDMIKAWQSHDTLFRQAGEKFQNIINEISNLLTMESYMVPYSTKMWFAIKRN